MLKIFLRKIFFIYFIIFFSSVTCDDNYQVNLDGHNCQQAPNNPNIPEDCTNYNTEDTACCYVEIEKIPRSIDKKCVEVPRDARFALNHLTIFSLKTKDGTPYNNVIGKFYCGQEDKFCGMNNPEQVFQCSEHSSTSKSCCFLSTPTYTECILSDKKYNEETTFTLFDESTVYCEGKIINKNGIFLMAFFIILSLLI